MTTTVYTPLPAHLENAIRRVGMAARTAAERTVDSLGLAAMSTSQVLQRDALIGAQFELNRKLAIFALTFNETLDRRVSRELGVLDATSSRSGLTSWDALSLVDDHEVEIQVSADRFALEITHACEWEIRDLDGFIGPMLKLTRFDPARNPLRAEIVGQAMIRAIESVSDRPDLRKVLGMEIGRALAIAMRVTYVDIANDLRSAGVKPDAFAVRQRANEAPLRTVPGQLGEAMPGGPRAVGHELSGTGRLLERGAGQTGLQDGGADPTSAVHPGPSTGGAREGRGALPAGGRAEGELMSLMRRLSQSSGHYLGAAASPHSGAANAGAPELRAAAAGSAWDELAPGERRPGLGQSLVPNLIVAHRDELRQASNGTIDHMVIDVIAGLFDQILSDPKVPPQMARQIGRLQLPVLRAALGDTSFFSSRRHPVRRFVNRIASLGSAVDDFADADGLALLDRVGNLVQEVVDGDFDQIELYEHKLNDLEGFIAAQARARAQAEGSADQLLARKELQLRLAHRYAAQLDGALQAIAVPEFLRQFLGQVWSRAIALTDIEFGTDSAQLQRMREVGRELAMSVQPKGVPALRANFLRQLPQLMKDLNAGLDKIRCADDVRRDFFAQLLPAHAESLKGQALSTLDHNMLARQVEAVMATPVPKAGDLPPATLHSLPVLHNVVKASDFSAAEARAVGMIDEASIDWNGMVDIDVTAEAEVTAADMVIAGLPALDASEPAEPMRGKSLVDHVQIGFAYQMHLEGSWQKVRLAHISAARTFFIFSHGSKQRKTISMTYRMLARLCETGRIRAFENAYLIERATARARRQLAHLSAPAH